MDAAEIKKALEIFKPSELVEVRTFGKVTMSGYFRNMDNLITHVSKYPGETFYFVLNEIKEDCYSREQSEKILSRPKQATSDADIIRRVWLLIDTDPCRVTGVSATDEEKSFAKEASRKIYAYLRHVGFNDPVVADSGNGYHLLYRIDLKNDDGNKTLIANFLKALDMLFSDEHVSVDISVFNAARVTKLYGTMARKGANTAERPHRQSKLLAVPAEITPTSGKLIQQVAALLPKPEKPAANSPGFNKFNLAEFLSKHGIRIAKTEKCADGVKHVLETCVFNAAHQSPDAAIIEMSNGVLAYHCFHNSCQHYKWQDVRLMFEPSAYNPKEQPPRITKPPPVSQMLPAAPSENPKFLRLQDIKRYDRSQIISIPSGFSALDKKIIGFNKGELTVWSGGNGSGKSTILSQLALETINNGFSVAMFSGELNSDRAKNWIHLQAAGRLHLKPSQYSEIYYVPQMAGEKIDAWTGDKLWIYDNNFGLEVTFVLNEIASHISKIKTDVVIVDNLMSLDISKVQGDKYDKQSTVVLALSNMAKQHNIHIHFVCHPRKPLGFLRKQDISGSADITNAADNVIMMHRVNNDFKKNATEEFKNTDVKIAGYFIYSNVMEIMKNRDLGVEDELIGLFFEKESKRFLNVPKEVKNYKWDDFTFYEVQTLDDEDNPFLTDRMGA